jgi:phosphate acetyltransferase
MLSKQFLNISNNMIMTPVMFEYKILEQAQSDKMRIILPESSDDRVLRASEILLKRDIVDIILLGDEVEIEHRASQLRLDISKANIINPKSSKKMLIKFANQFYEMRKDKGLSKKMACDTMDLVSYFATMMIYNGMADGMVSGAIHTTADTVRPALQIIKTKPNINIVSSLFFMCLDRGVLIYADCAINQNPKAEELATIAISSADSARDFGIEAKIAMLSYSTGDSGNGEDVKRVREATKIVQTLRPDLVVDGPMQYDTAIDIDVARQKLPESRVGGRATIFIFPDLNTGNNTYKAVQRSTGALAIGPILQGLKKPINDLSRGCSVDDIVNTVAITAIQAQTEKGERRL